LPRGSSETSWYEPFERRQTAATVSPACSFETRSERRESETPQVTWSVPLLTTSELVEAETTEPLIRRIAFSTGGF
jgi:hypothetical protein